MNTHAVSHAPTVTHSGRPAHAGQAAKAAEGTAPATSADLAVEISLSEDAQSTLAEETEARGPGKSTNSPAHQARAMMAAGLADESYKNFGQLVSSLARGIEIGGAEGIADAVIADEGQAGEVADGGDSAEPLAPAAEGDATLAAPLDDGVDPDAVVTEDAEATPAEETEAQGPGESANSPAHRARAMMADGLAEESYKNFGQLVSSLARGIEIGGGEGIADEGQAGEVADGGDSADPLAPGAEGDAPLDETASETA